jgi:methylated-DNA-[protein]-cysteine S-methyltransferase
VRSTTVESPIGDLLLAGDDRGLAHLIMLGGPRPRRIPADWERDDEALPEARAQLEEYFSGARTEFDLELAPQGTPFELRVWEELRRIPYGETISYGELARRVGRDGAARAVGAANGRNPIAVIVPCHRVIGANGSLTGFGGGLERKRTLLDLEAAARAPRLLV